MRAGEGRTALVMLLAVFMLLAAYYFIKPAREGWLAVSVVKGLSKLEVKAYSSFAQTVLLAGVAAAYARSASLWPRRALVMRVNGFLAANLVVFWLLQPEFLFEFVPLAGVAFYLWVGMFSVLVVSQFWIFVADVYTRERGNRLVPLVAVGAAAGAIVGSWLGERLVQSGLVGSYTMILIATVPLALGTFLTWYADVLGPTGWGPSDPRTTFEPAASREGGAFDLIRDHRYLAATAVFVALVAWVNTTGENVLFGAVQESIDAGIREQGIVDAAQVRAMVASQTSTFYSQLYFWVNLMSFLLQALLVSRLLRYGGFAALFLTLPVLALVSYSAMALVPVIGVIKFMKIAENSANYSVQNTARHVLWLPTTSEMKYKAKPTVDTFCVRFGDALAALTVLVGLRALDLSIVHFFVVNIVILLVALAVGLVVVREHGRLTRAQAHAR